MWIHNETSMTRCIVLISLALFLQICHSRPLTRAICHTPLYSTLLLPYFESQRPPYFVQLYHISSNSRPHTISIQALCHLFAWITARRADVITHIGQASRTGKCERKPKLQSKQGLLKLPLKDPQRKSSILQDGFYKELIIVFILHHVEYM